MNLRPVSKEALFRFQLISQVHLRVARGESLATAVDEIASRSHIDLDGHLIQRTARTLYRWLSAYERAGLDGLEPSLRTTIASSLVLPDKLLDFITAEKKDDPAASIPELLRRARARGITAPDQHVDRTTLWRALQRMDVDVRRRKGLRMRDTRRFEYPHRMDLILADGKHFRAGVNRMKRVALFFLDDHSRAGLHVVVGTSETPELFLRGVYELVRKVGYFSLFYLDRGPGFYANDTIEVIGRLEARLIFGEAAYPEGHGKIERFNRTAKAQVLRFDRRPDVDANCRALELRLQHYLATIYNHAPHEGINNEIPWQRYSSDPKALRLPENDEELRRRFVVHVERTVSADHIVSFENVDYEVPRGLSGQRVTLHRRVLTGSIAVPHEGRLVDLRPVDLVSNAVSRRGRRATPERTTERALPKSAADLAFEKTYRPVIGPDGGFTDPPKEKK